MSIDLFEGLPNNTTMPDPFKGVISHPAQLGVRKLINDTYNSFPGGGTNFRRDFHNAGFTPRLFELFIFASLKEARMEVNQINDRPDFYCTCATNNAEYFIEVTTTNPSDKALPGPNPAELLQHFHALNQSERIRQAAIKVQYAIKRKVELNYHDLDWVRGKPLVVAVAPFHEIDSLFTVFGSVFEMLYGMPFSGSEETRLTDLSPFFTPEQNTQVSAVVYSNSGTWGKFSRIARRIDKYSYSCRGDLERNGIRYHRHSDEHLEARSFKEKVITGSHEFWSEGTVVFHNPHADFKCGPIFNGMALEFWVDKSNRRGIQFPPDNPSISAPMIPVLSMQTLSI